jgi:hypothetical protein
MNILELVEHTKQQMQSITGLPPDSVSRLDKSDDGWNLAIDMLEHRSIPRTNDLISSFEVWTDELGMVTKWKRRARFQRAQLQEDN